MVRPRPLLTTPLPRLLPIHSPPKWAVNNSPLLPGRPTPLPLQGHPRVEVGLGLGQGRCGVGGGFGGLWAGRLGVAAEWGVAGGGGFICQRRRAKGAVREWAAE